MIARFSTFAILMAFALFCPPKSLLAQSPSKYNLSKTPVLYTIGYAHLDTEWRWDYEATVNRFLKNTLDDNFLLLATYPDYVFNFTGARRYRMMKEYYPERYQQLKKWVYRDRWFVSGSSVDECDPNVPSTESIIRQVLYGNQYFRNEFGKESVDFMLPDCFGFQAHFPSALNHAGLKGFSTQKLSWGSAEGIPFNLGVWVGPDGEGLTSALNATSYVGRIPVRMDTVSYWVDRVMENGKKYGVYADYRYYGVGDVGGAPREEDVKNAVASLYNPDSKIKVYLSSSDQLFRDLTSEEKNRLPKYSGDLLLTQHSAGSITSQAYMKRWNRKNELLARAAEPLATMADWLNLIPYPTERLTEAWWLVLGSQMHDILPGTSIPEAYPYAWNDEVLAMNIFSSVLTHSADAVIGAMDTRYQQDPDARPADAIPVVVYNPVAAEREDVVEATLQFPDGAPEYIIVTDPSGATCLSQITGSTKTSLSILFIARMPALSLATFHVQGTKKPQPQQTDIRAGRTSMENDHYRLMINTHGDIHSLVDKTLEQELLSGNATLSFLHEHPHHWPAWNMDWSDRQQPPIGKVDGPAKITLVEPGPVRATFLIEREARGSVFKQWIQLAAGDAGKRVMIKNRVAWQSRGVSLKATFPLTAHNRMATYNLGLGTIERPSNEAKKYEVPSREWFDLTDASGKFGVSILEDCKFGSDKPNDSTLRLTLLYTPVTNAFHDQATQDWGIHDFTYGIYGHAGDWRTGLSEWQGKFVNQPLIAFQTTQHPGVLGKVFSIATPDTTQVDIRALKKAETGEGIVVRVQELFGEPVDNVTIKFPADVLKVTEVNGQEQLIKQLEPNKGSLTFDMSPFELKSFVVQLRGTDKIAGIDTVPQMKATPIALLYDTDVVSADTLRTDGNFPGSASMLGLEKDQQPSGTLSITYPAELFPDELTLNGIPFILGGDAPYMRNALECRGQKLELPEHITANKLMILAAAATDTVGEFRIGKERVPLNVQAFRGNIGQYDNRVWDQFGQVERIEPGFIKRDEIALYTPHLHNDTSNIAYQYGYLFLYDIPVVSGTKSIQLPENNAIKVFAITAVDQPWPDAQPVTILYDDFDNRPELILDKTGQYVTASMIPKAEISVIRKKTADELPATVTTRDYASILMPNGAGFYYTGTVADTIMGKPHSLLRMPALNDGMFDLMPEEAFNDQWISEGEGRIVIDLAKLVSLDSMHLFSALDLERGAPAFTIWGTNEETLPTITGDPVKGGWQFIGMGLPPDVWGESVALFNVQFDQPNQYRYLMLINHHAGHGPVWFREIDVFDKQE